MSGSVVFSGDGSLQDGSTLTVDLRDVTFDDFGLMRPTVGSILAVSDPIHLEVKAAFANAD